MAEKIVRNTEKKAAEPAKKAAEPAKKPAAARKPQTVITPNKPTGGSTVGLRIGAVLLWIVAIVCEVFAIMAITKNFVIRFTHNGDTNMWIAFIGFVVLDMAACITAAQLWKKANHIKPMSEKRGKFLFYLWNELGVIMACICFIPLIVLLLKSDKLDKKTKTIAAIIAAVALLITGAASADYHPISAEQKDEAESQINGDVYWTQFGHKYHLKYNGDPDAEQVAVDCPYIRESSSVYKGSVTEAIESGRTAICSYCAAHAADWGINLNLAELNVEGGTASENKDQVPVVNTTAAPTVTGGN